VNILVVTTKCPYPLTEGRALRTYNLLRQVSRWHELTLCTYVQSEEELLGTEKMQEFCAEVHVVPLFLRMPRVSLAMDIIREPFSSAPLHAIKYSRQRMRKLVGNLLANKTFGIVHLDMLHLGELVNVCEGRPIVLVQHNVESQILKRRLENERRTLFRAYIRYQFQKLRRYEYKLCQAVAHIITVSNDDSDQLRALGVDRPITCVPNAVDSKYFIPMAVPIEANTLVYVGSLDWFPNRDAIEYFLASIFPLIRRKIPDTKLTVIGQIGNIKHALQRNSGNNVKFAGLVDDIRPIVAKASAYVVPLRIGGGTRLKILDAMAMGKALVTTSIGCEGLSLENERHALVAIGEMSQAVSTLSTKKLRSTKGVPVCRNRPDYVRYCRHCNGTRPQRRESYRPTNVFSNDASWAR